MAIYKRVAGKILLETDRGIRAGGADPQGGQAAADATGELDEFTLHLSRLREQHRQRPTLIAMLDKAKLD